MKTSKQRSKGTGTLVLRGKTWCARWMVGGKVFTRTTGTSQRRDAEAKLAEFTAPFRLGGEEKTLETVAARLGGVKAELKKYEDDKPAIAVQHAWQAYLDQPNRPDSGDSTLRQYEFQYEAFARWAENEIPEAKQLREITQEHADRYAGYLQMRVSATTFNRHMNLLALVWRSLEKTARLSGNPWKQIGRKRFAVRSRRELTLEELGQVCAAAQGEIRLLLALGIYCGLRLGDAACLEWGSVDMARGLISLVPMKTARRSQKRVSIPIHRVLFNLLNEITPKQRKGYVLPELAEKYAKRRDRVCDEVSRLFSSCGITTSQDEAGRRVADVGYHSLRHTFVSLCAAGGVPQSVVQSLVGHGSPAMTAHYTHIGLAAAQNAVATLPDVTGAATITTRTASAVAGVLDALAGLSVKELETVAMKAREMAAARKTGQESKIQSTETGVK